MMKIQVSSGRGPVEVQRFVADLAKLLAKRHGWQVDVGQQAASVVVSCAVVPADLALGVHVLVSSDRGKGARKRWYASVTAHQEPAQVLFDRADVTIYKARASGPGGQNVNKRSTAVRLVHRPTKLVAKSSDQRSQKANLKVAFERLQAKLAGQYTDAQRVACDQIWGQHNHVRGAAVATYRRDRRGALCQVEAS